MRLGENPSLEITSNELLAGMHACITMHMGEGMLEQAISFASKGAHRFTGLRMTCTHLTQANRVIRYISV